MLRNIKEERKSHLHCGGSLKSLSQQDMQYAYDVRMRRVRGTIIAMEKQ
jgi:hypothetical protein